MKKPIKREQPTIELYMYSLNQEFPVGKGHPTFLKRYSELQQDISGKLVRHDGLETQVFNLNDKVASDWSAQWVSNQWIENHTKAAGVGLREFGDPFLSAILREEDFGAILFEPGSDRVFKLNNAGAELFKALRAKDREGNTEIAATAGYSVEQVKQFVDYLKAAGLWTRG